MIIDAHAHICDRVRGRTGTGATTTLTYGKVRWGDSVIRLLPPYDGETCFPPEVLLEYMDWVGVVKTVLLQGPFYGDMNAYVHQAVKRRPDRFIGAAYLNLMAEHAQEDFRRVIDDLGFDIVKLEISVATGFVGFYPDFRLDDSQHSWFWEEAEHRRLVVTLDLGAVGTASYQTQALENLLVRHPNLTLVIAHLAQPPI